MYSCANAVVIVIHLIPSMSERMRSHAGLGWCSCCRPAIVFLGEHVGHAHEAMPTTSFVNKKLARFDAAAPDVDSLCA